MHSRLPLALHEQLTPLGFYLTRTGAISGTVLAWRLPDPPHSAIAPIDAAVLEFGPTEILPPVRAI